MPSPSAKKEIQVSLFGQPCALTGPVSETALAALHSISPEQIPPDPDSKTARTALERLKTSTDVPAGLDGYRARLAIRLGAQIEFFDEFEKARTSGRADGLLSIARKHAAAHKRATIESSIRTLATSAKLKAKSVAPLRRELYAAWNEAVESHPEEEFHRAIRISDIAYVCSFDEAGEGDAEVESSE